MKNLVKTNNVEENLKGEKEVMKNLESVEKALRGTKKVALAIGVITSLVAFGTTTLAATDNPLTVVNNLSDFMFGLVKALGMLLTGFGIVQIGLSLKSHDASQRANGFLTLAGGVVIAFAKEILDLIVA